MSSGVFNASYAAWRRSNAANASPSKYFSSMASGLTPPTDPPCVTRVELAANNCGPQASVAVPTPTVFRKPRRVEGVILSMVVA